MGPTGKPATHREQRRFPPGPGQVHSAAMSLPDPERTRRTIGFILFMIATVVGFVLLVALFLLPPLAAPNPGDIYLSMIVGAIFAFPAGVMYLTVPRLLDRYDPEPGYALMGCLLWGGLAACGFSAIINTFVAGIGGLIFGAEGGDIVGAVVSAPLVEEAFKGIGLLGVFYFLRREFDGVVDGIIYATFIALGFATVENVIYYSQAAQGGQEVFAFTFFLRGVLAPWGHPLYTSMTGIGFGLARESKSGWVRMTAPVIGYAGAVFLHAVWNGSASLGDALGPDGGMVFLLLLPLWLIFVGAFLIMVIVLVRRRGRIIRENLNDEVAIGTIDRAELELVCSAFGLIRARMQHGRAGAEFVRATARLALSKWHTARAMENRSRTVSMDFIVPLRQRIAALRAGLAARG